MPRDLHALSAALERGSTAHDSCLRPWLLDQLDEDGLCAMIERGAPKVLSVVCPGLLCRAETASSLQRVREQAQGLPVEVLALLDDRTMSIGAKMNWLYAMASGEFVSTIADDDDIADDYVSSLVHAAQSGADAITFDVNWQAGETFLDWKVSSTDLRPMAAVRLSLARQFRFPDWWQSEDRAFRVWLRERAPSVHHVARVLYRYKFRRAKPEFGGAMYSRHSEGMKTAAEVRTWIEAQR